MTYLYANVQIRNSVLILPQKVAKHLVVTSGNTRLRSLRNTRLDYKSPFCIGNSRRLMVGCAAASSNMLLAAAPF